MPVRTIALPAVILLIAAAGLAAAGRIGPQALPSPTLLGAVTDSEGRPLPDATVELSLPATTGSARTVTTGKDGAYRFERVVPGLYVLSVRLLGFGPAIRDLEIGGGADEFRFDVRLDPLSRETVVVDPSLATPDRRVVCGLTMITPPNIDPKIVAPASRPPQAIPFNDRTIPVPSAAPPPSTAKPTMRIVQPAMCWDPTPAR